MIFERFFPQNSARLSVPGGASIACSTARAVEWDASWSKNLDPSGRAALGVHLSTHEDQLASSNKKIPAPLMIGNTPPRMVGAVGTPQLTIQS
uniref:Asparagine synthase (glutamine-hydrolyzing) n=1 Tax=Kalanchoe fedtschenkoi TaxID=63787 RepID=A0A7N0VH20_KALFE